MSAQGGQACRRPVGPSSKAAAGSGRKPTKARRPRRLRPPRAKARPKAPRARIAVSGSQSGLGLAIRRRLEAHGVRVIGIDLPGKGAEVEADLSTPEGSRAAVKACTERCGGVLQGAVANAGIDSSDAALTFEVNYHGATELLEGLRPALAGRACRGRGHRVACGADHARRAARALRPRRCSRGTTGARAVRRARRPAGPMR
jgi:NAD(P)-dependent dehydrogenase (short-subunit alcohol dehydrogenase family)